MHGIGFLLSLVYIVVWTRAAESLDCFVCSNAHNISDCQTTTLCASDEHCFTNARGVGNNTVFDLGCIPMQQCLQVSTQSPISIVGRYIDSRRATTDCDQCCSVNYCNKILCNHATEVITSTDGQCHDDPAYNCQLFSGTFNICGDVHHAKSVCRKWCGLCDLVDGKWSVWESWSKSDVSCGDGHRSRIRTCTEPKPSNGGLDCVGMSTETADWSLDICPVHGGWSEWSGWGSCSVTCGVGLQRRDRSCSNPYPGPNGNHCFGDARDDRSCFLRACSDGNWSDWTQWGTCSTTCNAGMMTRSRTCDNPPPSAFGKECVGNSDSYTLCNTHVCPAELATPTIVFKARNVTDRNANAESKIIFGEILTNNGGGYDASTGIFTAPRGGTYLFTVKICTYHRKWLQVHLIAADKIIGTLNYYNDDADGSCTTGTGVVVLSTGDTVWVKCIGALTNAIYENDSSWNSFSGVLIHT